MTMPEHPSEPAAVPPLAATLAGLRGGVSAPPPRSSAAARRTAARRHGARLALAGAAVAAVVVGVPVGVSLGADDAAPALVPSTSRPSPVPSPTDVPPTPVPSGPAPSAAVPTTSTVPPPPSPSAAPATTGEAPGTTAPPPTGPLVVTASDGAPVTAGELAGVDLGTSGPDDGEAGVFGRATWALDPCRPTAWPSDAARTGWASHGLAQGDGVSTREVAVYADEADAEATLSAFRRVAEACWADPGDLSATQIWEDRTPAGEEQTVVAGTLRSYDPVLDDGFSGREGMVWVAVREGRTVVLVTSADLYLGGYLAQVQGDTRPGAGSAGEDAAGYVGSRLDDARATAEVVLDRSAR